MHKSVYVVLKRTVSIKRFIASLQVICYGTSLLVIIAKKRCSLKNQSPAQDHRRSADLLEFNYRSARSCEAPSSGNCLLGSAPFHIFVQKDGVFIQLSIGLTLRIVSHVTF